MTGSVRTAIRKLVLTALLSCSVAILYSTPVQAQSGPRVNNDQVHAWNAFAESLLRIHGYWTQTIKTRQREVIGGYSRLPDFYREVETRDAKSDRLLSRIRWERAAADRVHSIELMMYDEKGRLSVDYAAAYLVQHRNAPIQTLINVHFYDAGLHAYRQFDASGIIIFERCTGTHFGEKIDLTLDEPIGPPPAHIVSDEIYVACFGLLPLTGDYYLRPERLVPGLQPKSPPRLQRTRATEKVTRALVQSLGQRIEAAKTTAALYMARGDALFQLQRFAEAVADYDKALELDDSLDQAYLGRGMAYGRIGELARGISDLTVFLNRNPTSSLGYTKRGVRYIWQRDFERARADLKKAVDLDENNAEAHDDLAVVLAQTGDLDEAFRHLRKAKSLEPGYQKVHHNLGMVRYLRKEYDQALGAVDDALALYPNVKDTLLLKAVILEALGKKDAAAAVRKRANALSTANWSERSAIR